MMMKRLKCCQTVSQWWAFHDYKKSGITAAKLADWSKQVGWESLVNKRGTTWRQLDESVQKKITTEKAAIALMIEKNSVIKRPLIEEKGKVIVLGFDEMEYEKKLKWYEFIFFSEIR